MSASSSLSTPQDERQHVDALSTNVERGTRDSSKDVHEWATEAMEARPSPSSTSPVEDTSLQSLRHRHQSDSAGVASSWRAKASAPPVLSSAVVGNHEGADSLHRLGSLSSEQGRNPRRSLQAFARQDNSSERPASMFSSPSPSALVGQAHRSKDWLIPRNIDSATQPHLKSCLKGAATSAIDDGYDTPTSPNVKALAGHFPAKSVHISAQLPRHRSCCCTVAPSTRAEISAPLRDRQADQICSSETFSRPERGSHFSPMKSTTAVHSYQQNSAHPSPSLTTSTCESEEDVPVLMTPMDEHTPQYGTMNVIRPLIEKNKQQVDHKAQLKIVTDLSDSSSSPADANPRSGFTADSEEAASRPPTLSRSTLLDIGRVEGTTPPLASRDRGCHSSNRQDSIVTTGLEMGLGVGMMSSLSIGRTSDNHFKRPGAPASIQMDDVAMGLHLAHNEMPHSSPLQPTHHSEQADSGMSREAIEHEESELSRRRTTGGLRKDVPPRQIGRRRIQRTGTQGENGKRPVGRPRHVSDTHRAGYRNAFEDEQSSFAASPFMEAMALHPATSPVNTPGQSLDGLLQPLHLRQSASGSYLPESHAYELSRRDSEDTSNMGYKRAVSADCQDFANNLEGGLMGINDSGPFGPGVRAKVADVMRSLNDFIPLTGHDDETVHLVEYGTMNSRSGPLFRNVVSTLAQRAQKLRALPATASGCLERTDYFGNAFASIESDAESGEVRFCITHEDSTVSDFRPLMAIMEAHPDSYRDRRWQAMHFPRLIDTIFTNFSMHPFATRIAPPRTISIGMSLMDLHWLHAPTEEGQSRTAKADAELTTFLKTRAFEFKKDGFLYVAYIARSDEHDEPESIPNIISSPSTSLRGPFSAESGSHSRISSVHLNRDIWTTLSNILAPCIQRLVSCGMLKSDVARHLLNLPLYPRSAAQTKAALHNVESTWKLEWSCGLGEAGPVAATVGTDRELYNEPQSLRLAHPAWKTYQSGCLASNPFSEHMIQLFKNIYESHFRAVLRDKGNLSKGAVEFILDSLWDALFSRIADREPSPIRNVEIEICVYALRRL